MQNRRPVLAGGYGTVPAERRGGTAEGSAPEDFVLPAQHRRPQLRLAIREMVGGVGRHAAVLAGLALLFSATDARAQQAPAPERMQFTVEAVVRGTAFLVPVQGDSVRRVATDSLSRSIRVGEIVRRCRRPVPGGRVVTWCRDTRANAARRQ